MTATKPEDNLLCSASGGIGRITFNRPQARKAVTFAMYERLLKSARRPTPTGRLRC